MKLISYAQIPKEVPYLHIGYMSASSFEIEYFGCDSLLIGGGLLFLTVKDSEMKMKIIKFFYALLILYVVVRISSNL